MSNARLHRVFEAGTTVFPGVYDTLSARTAEQTGFPMALVSGNVVYPLLRPAHCPHPLMPLITMPRRPYRPAECSRYTHHSSLITRPALTFGCTAVCIRPCYEVYRNILIDR